MPGLVKNHEHAARLNYSPFMDAVQEKMAEDDVMVLVHGYLAGGFAGKDIWFLSPQVWEVEQVPVHHMLLLRQQEN